MQIDHGQQLVNDFTRVATLQYTNSVGGANAWLESTGAPRIVPQPDTKIEACEKLTKINHRVLRTLISRPPLAGLLSPAGPAAC